MQLRNVQPEEAHSLAVSWGNVRLIVGLNPRMSKKGVGLDLLKASLPEAFQPHPLKAVPRFGVLDRNVPNREEMTELLSALGIAEVDNFRKIAWRDWLSNPPRDMWKHAGKCSCGRRTFLFGQCMRCIASEGAVGAEEEAEPEETPADETQEPKGEGPEVTVIAVSRSNEGTNPRIMLVNPDHVVSAAVGRISVNSTLEWFVDEWQPDADYSLRGGRASLPFRTVWVVENKACLLAKACHEHQKEERTKLTSSQWFTPTMHWELFAKELQVLCPAILRLDFESQDSVCALFQLAMMTMDAKELVIGVYDKKDLRPRDWNTKLTFVFREEKWQRAYDEPPPNELQIHVVGQRRPQKARTVVTLFSKDRTCFDRFYRLGETTVSYSTDVKLPGSRFGRAPRKVPLPPPSAEVAEEEEDEKGNLWAAEQWVEKNFRERKRLLEEEHLETEEKGLE
jgi:hypothetical protein